jgi:PAS domain S-box-containing protein
MSGPGLFTRTGCKRAGAALRRRSARLASRAAFLVVLAILQAAVSTGAAGASERPSVLLLQSYHPGLSWSDGIEDGVRAGLEGRDVDLSVEYLDSRRRPLAAVAGPMSFFLRAKYAAAPPDLILAADNSALAFLQRHSATVFPDAPIVFAGVNHFRPALLSGLGDRATGLVEQTDPLGTGRLIRRLLPETERLVVISGSGTTGRAIRAETEHALWALRGPLDIEWWDAPEMEALPERLAGLGPRDAVLLTVLDRDARGRFFGDEESVRLIAEASPAPVFGLWDYHLGTGVVGGRMAGSRFQGRRAAELALRILGGEAPTDIPIVRELLVADRFDAEALARFGIPRERLPEGSILVNDTRSWVDRHWRTVTLVLSLMAVEAVALAALSWLLFRTRRRAARAHREAAMRKAATLHSIGDAVIATDREGRIVEMNRVAESLTGWPAAEALGRPFDDVARLLDGESRRPLDSPIGRLLRDGRVAALPEGTLLVDRAGAERTIADSAAPIRDRRGRIIGVVLVFRDVTAEQTAGEEIRRLNERFELAASAAGIGVWEFDPQSDRLVWDDRMFALYGIRREGFPGAYEAWTRGLHPDDLPRSNAEVQEALRDGTPFDTQFRIVLPSGEVRHIRAFGQVLTDRTGAKRMIGANYDVTDLTRLTEALAVSERRFRDVAETMSDWIWEIDLDMRYTYVGGNVGDVLGFAPEELLGRSCLDSIVDPPPEEVAAAFRELAARRAPIDSLENWNRTKDGRLVCLSTSGVPVAGADGTLLGYRGMDKDVTDRKRFEEELKLRERALDAAANGVIISRADADQPIVYCNPAFERITGYPPEEVLGRNCRFLQNDDRDQPALTAMREAFAEGRPFSGLLRNYRKSGELFWNQCSIAPVHDGHGRISHFVGIQQDVTEHQRHEAELRHAWQAAEVANKAKSEFLAMMSHELRTPLNAINGFSEMMERGVFGPLGDPHYAEYAQHIHSSGEYLLALINDVLDMSKIEAGKMTLNEEYISLYEAAETALGLVSERASNHSLLLVSRLQPDLPEVLADMRAIKQVLLNLLSNAIKFTPPGGRVELTIRTDADGSIVLSVCDTGIGISPDDQDAVMEPFRQANNRLSTEREGTGLGLSLVKALVELHGGSIHLESRLDEGTTVGVRLPASRARSIAAE